MAGSEYGRTLRQESSNVKRYGEKRLEYNVDVLPFIHKNYQTVQLSFAFDKHSPSCKE